ncbi:MAG: ABC transporter permease [Solirubrobacterales bacterium]
MNMIFKSIIKHKGRNILILIQLSIAFFSMSFGIGMVEASISHISKVKSLVSSDTINFIDIGENNKPPLYCDANLIKLYDELKGDNRIDSLGTFTYGYIKSEESIKPDKRYSDINVLLIDNSLEKILVNVGKLKPATTGTDGKTITALAGKNVQKLLSIGSDKKVRLDNGQEYSVKITGELDKDLVFFLGSNAALITEDSNVISLDNSIVVVLPETEKSLYLSNTNNNLLIKLQKGIDENKFISDLKERSQKLNINPFTHDINYEINAYLHRNEIPMYFSIGFSLAILVLSSFGMIGVILSSIIRRKTEFGIRYALGSTPKNMVFLIVGEIIAVFIAGDFIGSILAFILSLFTDGIKVGLITVSSTTAIMLIFAFLSSLAPALRTVKMEPVKLIGGD